MRNHGTLGRKRKKAEQIASTNETSDQKKDGGGEDAPVRQIRKQNRDRQNNGENEERDHIHTLARGGPDASERLE